MSEMKVTSEGSLSVSSGLLSAWSWPFILKDFGKEWKENVPNYQMMGKLDVMNMKG